MSIWTMLRDWIFGMAESFFNAAINAVVEQGGSFLIESATRAVAAANDMDGDSEAKFKAAFDSVTNDMSTRGVDVSKSIINVAIEAAYQNLKADMAEDGVKLPSPE